MSEEEILKQHDSSSKEGGKEKDKKEPAPSDDFGIEPEVLDKLPGPARKRIIEMMSISMAGPMHPPFLRKINEEHISKLIECSEKDSQRDFEDTKSSRRYALVYLILSFILFGFIVVYLADRNPDLLKEVLKISVIFAGGFGAGYGVKSYQGK